MIREELEGPLGKIAFDPQRKDSAGRKRGEIEPNTEIEDDIYKRIMGYVSTNYAKSDPHIDDVLRQVIASGEYSDMIKPPDQSYVYRGMGVDEETMKTFIGAEDLLDVREEPWIMDNMVKIYDRSFLLNPGLTNLSRALSSWTTEIEVARRFSFPRSESRGDGSGGFAVVLYASPAENPSAFLDISGMYNLKGVGSFSHEKEVIGIGEIKVSKVEYRGYKYRK